MVSLVVCISFYNLMLKNLDLCRVDVIVASSDMEFFGKNQDFLIFVVQVSLQLFDGVRFILTNFLNLVEHFLVFFFQGVRCLASAVK
jgi:hypothetical protein